MGKVAVHQYLGGYSLKSLELKKKPGLKADYEPDVTTSIDESGSTQSTKKPLSVLRSKAVLSRI